MEINCGTMKCWGDLLVKPVEEIAFNTGDKQRPVLPLAQCLSLVVMKASSAAARGDFESDDNHRLRLDAMIYKM